jgi:phage shock protein PspC (stress-responsive transcriptional regulator)
VSATIAQPPAGLAPVGGERPMAADRSGGRWWLLGGVAAELSERLAVPVAFIRTLLVLASFAQGDVWIAYVVVTLLLPRGGQRRPNATNLIAVARVGIALGLVWGLVGGDLSPTQGLFDQSPAVWITQCGVCLVGLLALLATGRPASERDVVRDRATVRAGLPVAGLLAGISVGVILLPSVRWERVLEAATVLAGLAILLPGRPGRAADRIVPAAVLAAVTIFLAGAGARLEGGVGNTQLAPTSPAAIAPSYRRAVGDLTIDLSGLARQPATVVLSASVGIGRLIVDLPTDAQISLVERVGRGELYDRRGVHSGVDLRRSAVIGAIDPRTGRTLGRPRLRLRILLSVGVGHVEIDQTGPDEFGAL